MCSRDCLVHSKIRAVPDLICLQQLPQKFTTRCLGKTLISSSRTSSSESAYGKWRNILYTFPPLNFCFSDFTDYYLHHFFSLVAARSPRSLSERRISHIVSVCADPIPADSPASGIRQLRIPVEDVEYADLLIHLPMACRFIHQALSEGGVVLVHCEQGLSRSATVVAAYCK